MIRTRAAISPTGFPHIGTIYQVLFDFAYAKKHKGKFIVRIEDTDRVRFVKEAEKKVYEALDWFNLVEDESPRKEGRYGPYRQSERLSIYKKLAEELIEKGQAYYCFCSKERLEEVRKKKQAEGKIPMYDKCCRNLSKEKVNDWKEKKSWVIRLKVPENTKIIVKDEIRGTIEFNSNEIDDQVLLKSDSYPTYFLAVTVDDHLMKITHMVRGEEWLPSSPKIILIYDYFKWEKPYFIHTPVIRNPDKSKFSKRQGHTNVSWYQEQGYLPEAILNYLSLMGWSHPEGKDIFSLEEFINLFDFKDIKPVGPIFDLKKLEWMNGEYLRKSQNSNLKTQIWEFYDKKYSAELIEKTIPLIKERIKKLSDYLPLCEFFFQPPATYEVTFSATADLLKSIYDSLSLIKEWKVNIIGQQMQNLAKELNVKNSEFFMILRVVMTGKKISPPLNESMEILGKDESLKRIKKLA